MLSHMINHTYDLFQFASLIQCELRFSKVRDSDDIIQAWKFQIFHLKAISPKKLFSVQSVRFRLTYSKIVIDCGRLIIKGIFRYTYPKSLANEPFLLNIFLLKARHNKMLFVWNVNDIPCLATFVFSSPDLASTTFILVSLYFLCHKKIDMFIM